MPLIQLLEVLIVVGVLLWLVNRFIPMQGTIKSILNGVVVIAVVLWILNVFGLFSSLSPNSRWHLKDDVDVKDDVRENQPRSPQRTHTRYIQRNTADERLSARRYLEIKAFISSRNHPQYERTCSNQFTCNHGH